MPETKQLQSKSIENLSDVYGEVRRKQPLTKRDLRNYVKVFLGVNIPDKKICAEHSSPMDYLWHVFRDSEFVARGSENKRLISTKAEQVTSHEPQAANSDCIVWANRAGGKTEIAAIATLLDCIFKSKCQVRILAGSGEQASRMYDYLVEFLYRGFEGFLAKPPFKTRCLFKNDSSTEVLTQSAKSVRGRHIQKL
jgi:hypothetical protein